MKQKVSGISLLVAVALLTTVLPQRVVAQDYDDPPGRVARLGYMEGSVSFLPAGESDWVQAVPNLPMTTGDQLWADQDSRAEVQLGSAVIRLAASTGFSFLNLDDHTIQIQLSSGSLNIRVRRLGSDDVFEVDTPNQAFSVFQSGRYRVEASDDGSYTVVSVRDGEGEATGNGQSYTLEAGQRGTFSGTDSLNAQVEDIYDPDDFDLWAYSRDRRHDVSRSAQYLSADVVGYDDLDSYGEWRDDSNYGHIWFPTQVPYGWAPYHDGHWAWVSPWGWTWVDDAPWGYAPFHYGRWVNVGGQWGWVAGPANVAPVYAPALVVFIGGGDGGNVGWFPLGPREVYVPSYYVSQEYMTRVNISNTTVSNTTIVNVYRTTSVNNNTRLTNVTYVNRSVAGAVTAVPQHAFASAQPVARASAAVNARDMAAAPVTTRAAVAPSHESVLGSKASSAGHVAAPPPAVAHRQVVAKAPPPPPPVPFARQQQALAAHPGQALGRHEVQTLRPANSPAARPMVKLAPPGKPATPTKGQPGNRPAPNPRPGATNPAPPNVRPEPMRPEVAPRPQPAPPSERPQPAPPVERPQQPKPSPEKTVAAPPPKPKAPTPEAKKPQDKDRKHDEKTKPPA